MVGDHWLKLGGFLWLTEKKIRQKKELERERLTSHLLQQM